MLQALSEKWLLVELNHTVSKAATDAFWQIATSLIPSLYNTKDNLGITRKTPQFVHIRRKLQAKFLPKIHHSTSYQDDNTNEIVGDMEFNPNNSQKKVFETASVKVILITADANNNRSKVLSRKTSR